MRRREPLLLVLGVLAAAVHIGGFVVDVLRDMSRRPL